MKKWIGKITTIIICFSMSLSFGAVNSSVEGYWKTIDDVTGKPKSIVKIWKTKNDSLMGRVVRIFPKEGENPNKLCEACVGEKHNQPIVGMIILSGLQGKERHWHDGKILDPENGKHYKCSARLTSHGGKLNVRGYIGMPLFGRSQLWERVNLISS